MTAAHDPAEVFDRAAETGRHRLDQSPLEQAATSFIAGSTVVFGIAALGIAHAAVAPELGGVARPVGALAFAAGFVFLVVGRTELFNENFFDPVAAAIEQSGSWLLVPIVRLWVITLAFNLVGGVLFVVVLSVDGALPAGSSEALRTVAEESAHRNAVAGFANAVAGGALVSLLSSLLQVVDGDGTRLTLGYLVGFLLALGPFEHVVVTVLHLLFGLRFGAAFEPDAVVVTAAVVTAGNLVGGLGLVTFSHAARAMGARRSGG